MVCGCPKVDEFPPNIELLVVENVVCPPNMEFVVLLLFPNGDCALVVDILVFPKRDATDVSIAALAAPNNEEAQVLTVVGDLNIFWGFTLVVELGVPNIDPVFMPKVGNDAVTCWGLPNTDTWVVGVWVGEIVSDDAGVAEKTFGALEEKEIVVVVGVKAETGAVVVIVAGASGILEEPKETWLKLLSIGIAIVSDVIGIAVLCGSIFLFTVWSLDFVKSVGNGLFKDMDTFGGTIFKLLDFVRLLTTELVVVVTGLSLSFWVEIEGKFRLKLLGVLEDVTLKELSNDIFWGALFTTFGEIFVIKVEFVDTTVLVLAFRIETTGCFKNDLISVFGCEFGWLTGGKFLGENVVLGAAENADEMAGAKENEKFLSCAGAEEAGIEKFNVGTGDFATVSVGFSMSLISEELCGASFISGFTEDSVVNPVTGEGVNTLKEDVAGIVGVFGIDGTAVGTAIDGEIELGKLIVLDEIDLSSPEVVLLKIFWNIKAVEGSEKKKIKK